MRITDAMKSAHVRFWLTQAEERMFNSQSQAASGQRVQRPSDDPLGFARAALLRADAGRQEQYLKDVESAQFWLKSSEATLGSLTEQVRSLRDLALRGAGQLQDPEERATLVASVRNIEKQLTDLANTRTNGRYLFAGQASNTLPVDLSGGLPPSYAGSAAPPVISISPITELAVGVTADRVFNLSGAASATNDDLISTCSRLGDLMESGDAQAVSQLISELDFHLSNVLAIRGEVGSRIQVCETVTTRLTAEGEAATVALSELIDADLSQVLIELSQHQQAYQAAAGIAASLHSVSLLDFLR